MRHPHADLIKEWAEDTSRVVQWRLCNDDIWEDIEKPMWNHDFEYRFKPEKKPDVVRYARAYPVTSPGNNKSDDDNLKLTFSGEDGRLIKAEVIGE